MLSILKRNRIFFRILTPFSSIKKKDPYSDNYELSTDEINSLLKRKTSESDTKQSSQSLNQTFVNEAYEKPIEEQLSQIMKKKEIKGIQAQETAAITKKEEKEGIFFFYHRKV